jgi:hypothetical protein
MMAPPPFFCLNKIFLLEQPAVFSFHQNFSAPFSEPVADEVSYDGCGGDQQYPVRQVQPGCYIRRNSMCNDHSRDEQE